MTSKTKTIKRIPTQFDPAEPVGKIARVLIPEYHSSLINSKISYLFINKEMKKRGKRVAATAEKVSPKFKALTSFDFIITVSYPIWNELSEPDKIALVDHELTHCFVDESEEGDPKPIIVPHDFEDFISIIERRGLYSVEAQSMYNVLKSIKLGKSVVVRKMGDPESAEIEDEVLEDKPKKKSLKIKKTKTKDSEDENDLLDMEE